MTNSTIDIIRKKHNAPGFHYLLFNSEEVIRDVYSGFQNEETNIPVNDRTSFHAFSITKTFTAVAIMQLVQRGSLTLEDPIANYLPSYSFSKPVTIRQLLCHQSGIANPLPLKWTHLESDHTHFDYKAFSESIILGNLKLKNPPGRKFAYSNINYLILGRLIEEVSGKEYDDYIKEYIFNQLPTSEYLGFDIPESNHATGYHANTWFQNLLLSLLFDKKKMMYASGDEWTGFNPFYINGRSYGGVICSPNALMEFCRALMNKNEPLLPTSLIEAMLSPQQTADGKETIMSLGWFKGAIDGKEYYCHAGGGGGYYCELRLYPALGVSSVIMMNSSGMKDDRILDHLDIEYLRTII